METPRSENSVQYPPTQRSQHKPNRGKTGNYNNHRKQGSKTKNVKHAGRTPSLTVFNGSYEVEVDYGLKRGTPSTKLGSQLTPRTVTAANSGQPNIYTTVFCARISAIL